nr:hypothetical protein [Desulfotalea psychrophila]
MGLALDEPKDNDKSFDFDSITFLIEESLLETTGGVKVDYLDAGPRSGFSISSVVPLAGGGGCSSGSCSSGSCG